MSLEPGAVSMALLGAALKAGVLLSLGFLAAILLRRASAASRHVLWGGVMVAVLFLPVVAAVVPSWEPASWSGPTLGEAGSALAPAVPAATGLGRGAGAPDGSSGVAPVPFPDPVTGSPGRTTLLGALELPPGAAGLTILVLLAGTTTFLGLLGRSVLRLGRTVREGRRVAPTEPRARRLAGLTEGAGLGRTPVLVETSACGVPFVWGLLEPSLVLPVESREWSPARLDAVFLHELAHLRQRDVPLRIAAELVCALHWFNPLAWFAARRLRAEGEAACDDAVLEAGLPPEAYVGALMGMGVERSWQLRTAGAMAGGSSLGIRIEALLDRSRSRGAPSRALRTGVLVGVLAILVPLAALAPAGAQEAERREVPAPRAPEADASRSGTPADAPIPLPDRGTVGVERSTDVRLPVHARWSTPSDVGAVFTEGAVNLDGASGEEGGAPGFFLLVSRDEGGTLRSARAVVREDGSVERSVRGGPSPGPWFQGTGGWLTPALELAGAKLAGLGRELIWRGAPLGREGDRRVPDVSGSVMTGLPATTEDGGRGVLVAGWTWEDRRAGLFVCGSPGAGSGATAARDLLRRIRDGDGAGNALEPGECLLAFTWDPEDRRLRMVEAYRPPEGPTRVHASMGAEPVASPAVRDWLEALLRSGGNLLDTG